MSEDLAGMLDILPIEWRIIAQIFICFTRLNTLRSARIEGFRSPSSLVRVLQTIQ
jgi:hypothetical protein